MPRLLTVTSTPCSVPFFWYVPKTVFTLAADACIAATSADIEDKGIPLLVDQVGSSLDIFYPHSWNTEEEPPFTHSLTFKCQNFHWNNFTDDFKDLQNISAIGYILHSASHKRSVCVCVCVCVVCLCVCSWEVQSSNCPTAHSLPWLSAHLAPEG